jgi:hypothetical protein
MPHLVFADCQSLFCSLPGTLDNLNSLFRGMGISVSPFCVLTGLSTSARTSTGVTNQIISLIWLERSQLSS